MAEKKSSGCLKAFVIFTVLSVVLTAVLGGGLYILWQKKGKPSLAQIEAQLEAGETQAAESGLGLSEIQRPVVAKAPLQAGPDTYSKYVNRKDVLTLVNYYSDT